MAGYDELATIGQQPSVFVDMAGDKAVRIQLHQHLEDNMKASLMVGATHWDAWRPDDMSAPCRALPPSSSSPLPRLISATASGAPEY